MNNIKKNIEYISDIIDRISIKNKRNPEKIKLIVVSKMQPVSSILEVVKCGYSNFGENYVQEGIKKIIWFRKHKNKKLTWHFIGKLQSNKSNKVAKYFDWCHTINSYKLALKLNDKRFSVKKPLNVLIQINIDNEIQKNGISSEELFYLSEKIYKLPMLKFRGIMVLPKKNKNFIDQLNSFKEIVSLFKKLKCKFNKIDTISMGMTEDIIPAILAGTTMLRIGSAIFGERVKK